MNYPRSAFRRMPPACRMREASGNDATTGSSLLMTLQQYNESALRWGVRQETGISLYEQLKSVLSQGQSSLPDKETDEAMRLWDRAMGLPPYPPAIEEAQLSQVPVSRAGVCEGAKSLTRDKQGVRCIAGC